MKLARVGCMLGLVVVTAGCLLASGREKEPHPPTLTAAKVYASFAAPMLPIYTLRIARDELGLDTAGRASVAMILEEAEAKSHVMVHARAAFLEILAQGAEEGSMDETQVALYAEQVVWAADVSSGPLRTAMTYLYDLLTPEQRALLVSKVEAKMPAWSATWASASEHRWVAGFPQRDLADFGGDLTRTARGWTDRSAANVRGIVRGLDGARREALAASLRTGVFVFD